MLSALTEGSRRHHQPMAELIEPPWLKESIREQESPIKKERTCTDTYELILMVAYFVILLALSAHCVSNGDISRILNGYDNCGNVCGKNTPQPENVSIALCNEGNNVNKRFLLVRGVGRLIFNPSSVERLCVSSCDDYPDYEKFLNRCIPKKNVEQIDSFFSRTGIADFFQEVSEDIDLCWQELIYLCLIALGLSGVMLLLLRFAAGIVVYLVIIIVAVLSIAGTITLWILWNKNRKQQIKTANGTTETTYIPTGNVEQRLDSSYLAYAIISTIITLIILLILVVMRKRIELVVLMFKEAGTALHSMPGLLAQPLVTYACIAVTVWLWLYVALWVESAGTLTKVSSSSYRFLKDNTMKFTRWYNLMGFFWISQFIFGCQNMVIAGATTTWFFNANKDQLNSPIKEGIWRLIRYHLGSVALGSLLVAIVMLARVMAWLLRYWKKKCGLTEERNEVGSLSTNWTKIAAFQCCCCSIGSCFQNIVLFLSRNAYIQIAIRGCSFCEGGRQAVKVLSANSLRLMAINSVGDWVLSLAKIIVVIGTLFFGILLIQAKDGVQHAWVPLVLSGIFSYAIAHSFMSVYEMAIDSIFMCFCEECEINNGVKDTSHLSPQLLEFMNRHDNAKERY
ncbi:choline transporter-like protein 1 isoform X2 [Ischnura elegans]|uniref:choline transporter-like protein 1 isoform X2 n=1 Tax=Ischnura elegans TaxID=197161 RepID=UPI001ED89C6E|nr:choline transporter-like protein 1 isoform X2 [Ischnura elegans]